MEETLTPSYHGKECKYNGNDPNCEIACDECDFYLTCFPDYAAGGNEGNENAGDILPALKYEASKAT